MDAMLDIRIIIYEFGFCFFDSFSFFKF